MTAPGEVPRVDQMSDDELRALVLADARALPPMQREALRAELDRRLGPVSGVTIVAPQPVVYPKAPVGERFVASVVDKVLSYGPLLATGILTALSGGGFETVVGWIAIALSFVWMAYYNFTKDGREGGQSIGKRMFGLMVVHIPTNAPCTKGQSALREIVKIAFGMVPLLGWLIEPIKILSNDKGQRFGDEAAHTQVIRARDYQPTV